MEQKLQIIKELELDILIKDIVLAAIKPFQIKVETLARNNNILVESNNGLVAKMKTLTNTVNDLQSKVQNLSDRNHLIEESLKTTSTSPEKTNKSASDLQVKTRPKQPSVIGDGDEIGIQRLFHIAISRIPLRHEFDENWLKTKVQKKLSSLGAEVQKVEALKSAKLNFKPKSKSFKISIAYKGNVGDIYKPEFYPQYARVTRFNFPKRRRYAVGDQSRQTYDQMLYQTYGKELLGPRNNQ